MVVVYTRLLFIGAGRNRLRFAVLGGLSAHGVGIRLAASLVGALRLARLLGLLFELMPKVPRFTHALP